MHVEKRVAKVPSVCQHGATSEVNKASIANTDKNKKVMAADLCGLGCKESYKGCRQKGKRVKVDSAKKKAQNHLRFRLPNLW